MCGRFATGLIAADPATPDWLGTDSAAPSPDWADDWPRREGAPPLPGRPAGDWPAPSWNVAPTQTVAMVLPGEAGGPRRVVPARWGLVPHWWRKPLSDFRATTFNARSEEAAAKPMFRDAWKRGRCLIPALGYYEWAGKGASKRAHFVTARTNRPGIAFAGLWARAEVGGETILSCTVLTTAAGEATKALHPRSPVVLDEAAFAPWLAGEDPRLGPIEDERAEVREVDRAVGNVRNDDPGLVEAAALF